MMHARTPRLATVLVIDGDEDSRTVYRPLLEASGLEVLEARDGTAGLSLAREHVPDVVVTELTLSGVDGFTLISQLRERLRDVVVVVLTARRVPEDRDRAERAGCTLFLEKPVPPQVLLGTVVSLLR